jgi:hypothetical protein
VSKGDIHNDPMNDIGDYPAPETWVAWVMGWDPSVAKKVVKLTFAFSDRNWGAQMLALCESPIERLFLIGLALRTGDEENPFETAWTQGPDDPEARAAWTPRLLLKRNGRELVLQAQRVFYESDDPWSNIDPIGAKPIARVDFVICDESEDPLLAIEIDGHEFHERTKEQAQADRSRDRLLLRCGVPVVRFTGSEVHADPMGCAREAFDLAEEMVERIESIVETSVSFEIYKRDQRTRNSESEDSAATEATT